MCSLQVAAFKVSYEYSNKKTFFEKVHAQVESTKNLQLRSRKKDSEQGKKKEEATNRILPSTGGRSAERDESQGIENNKADCTQRDSKLHHCCNASLDIHTSLEYFGRSIKRSNTVLLLMKKRPPYL